MSLVFDRATGLVALVLLAGIAGLAAGDHTLAQRVTVTAWALLAAGAVVSAIYFSPRLRRATRLHHLLAKLNAKNPIRRLDAAAVAYHHHPRTLVAATAISLALHVTQITATAMAGYALGLTTPWTLLLVVMAVVLAAGSLPLTYQGLGVMEALAVALLVRDDQATTNQVVTMLVVMRLYLLTYGLAGSLVLLRRDIQLHPPDQP